MMPGASVVFCMMLSIGAAVVLKTGCKPTVNCANVLLIRDILLLEKSCIWECGWAGIRFGLPLGVGVMDGLGTGPMRKNKVFLTRVSHLFH